MLKQGKDFARLGFMLGVFLENAGFDKRESFSWGERVQGE
jgi:hypothetical protein